MSRWSGAIVLALLSCGAEESIEPAQFAELCGVAGPVRLIALAPDQIVRGGIEPFEGRYVYISSRLPLEADGGAFTDTAAWSVGPCGEDPRRIADDVTDIFTDGNWPGVLLGCRDQTRDIVTLDPAGVGPPHVVFAGVHCVNRREAATGFVTLDGEEGEPAALIWHAYPDDPRRETSQRRVLLDPISTPEYPLTGGTRPRMLGEQVFVVTSDDRLLRVDPADGAVAVEQTGVRDFQLSVDRRYLLYQDLASTGEDPESTEGVVVLRDRTTGEGVTLATTTLAHTGNAFAHLESGLFTLTLSDGARRVYFLPGLNFVDLPVNLALRAPLGDGRWLLQEDYFGPLHVTDLREAGSTRPVFGAGRAHSVTPDSAIVIELPALFGGDETAEGAVWRAYFDERPPLRLADRASQYSRLIGERRMITRLDIDAQGVGDLVLVDLDTREERLVDRRVDTSIWSWSAFAVEDDVVRYTIVDGERSGVWMVRLPAR